jgi:hypothetical protein
MQSEWNSGPDGQSSPSVRAAQILLENGLKVAGDDLDQRLSRLEERWQETSGGPDLRILSG